jgi:CIC family chloride channel protein
LTVRHLARRAPECVRENLPFERVLKAMGEAHLDQLPVVNEDSDLLGLISFQEVKEILYDPHLRDLVNSADLMNTVERTLEPEASLQEALALLDEQHAQSWPVTEGARLYGVLRRHDVYSVYRRAFRGRNGS